MRHHLLIFCLWLVGGLGMAEAQSRFLWYDSPAKEWESELPLGNGRLGCTLSGDIHREIIPLSEISMWSGSRDTTALNPEAKKYLPEIREALRNGDNYRAQSLVYDHFKAGGKGSNYGSGSVAPYGSFEVLGFLNLTHHLPKGEVKHYRRELLLSTALAHTFFDIDSVHFTRSYFASHGENDLLVIRLSADRKGQISFTSKLSRPENGDAQAKDGHLYLEGQLPDGFGGNKGVKYSAEALILPEGGRMTSSGDSVSIKEADAVMILIAATTSNTPPQGRPAESPSKTLAQVVEKGIDYETLLRSHVDAYSPLFRQSYLSLKQDSLLLSKPTDTRLRQFQAGNDLDFPALYFDYGRYLMLSGTRPNSWPMNLQGLWTNLMQAPWNGDYHLNINLQMNYWPVEPLNLPEYHIPLLDYIKALVPSGRETAKTFYGADGWVAHMMSNPWFYTAPGEDASWGATNTGGAWLSLHIWDHFLFTQDTLALKKYYPVMLEAGKFCLSVLTPDKSGEWLVTAPSSSPENGYYLEDKDKPLYITMGPTMDTQIIRTLFTALLDGAEVLKLYDPALTQMANALPLLPPNRVSEKGYLMEWLDDYPEVEPHHRHVSHLFGLYPGTEITPLGSPELAKAAKVTLERRGDEGTGWSRAWKILFWARLGDGNRAYKLLTQLLQPAISDPDRVTHKSGTYPNLFCAHPPFQIDGNMGGTAGIIEMLLQSHAGYIELLPAIPDEWKPEGSFSGFKARGGIIISCQWKDGRVSTATFETSLPKAHFNLKRSTGQIETYEITPDAPLKLTDL